MLSRYARRRDLASGGLVEIVLPEACGGGVLHAAGIHAEHLAQLGVVGRLGAASFLGGAVFGPLQHVVQVGQQIGADHS